MGSRACATVQQPKRRLSRIVALLTMVTVMTCSSSAPSFAIFGFGDIVFDPKNYIQNLLVAGRTIKMINNQVRQLQNEARMLLNQSRHLQRLDYNAANRLASMLSQINVMMNTAEGISFRVEATDSAYKRYYPRKYADSISNDDLMRDARQRWKYSHNGYQQSLRLQAQISETITNDQVLISELLSSSSAAVGTLQVGQATNQLLALTAQQNSKTQAMMAAHYRAQALKEASSTVAEEAARARFERFIGDGNAYSPLR